MWEKSKKTTKCEKRTVTCDVGTAQCEDETIKCVKKVWEPPNVAKKLSYVILEPDNMRMKLSNLRKKVREPPMCGKTIITCDVEIA